MFMVSVTAFTLETKKEHVFMIYLEFSSHYYANYVISLHFRKNHTIRKKQF